MQYLNPDIDTIYQGFDYDYVVGPSVEVERIVGTQMNVDLSDTTVLFTFDFFAPFSSGGTFNGVHIEDTTGTIADLTSVTLTANPGTTLPPGFGTSRVTWDADNIYVDFGGLAPGYLHTVRLDLTAIPEPTTALLLATGLAGIAAARRRRSLH